ncbi:type VI secretion system-associated protein TagF [Phyllobacterium myrsinacearum]|uniref:Type VI secretion system protein ImpM n=1 Tax=Phyllobacterium myrsinacearum TaxID=28101 RepID=A0A839ELM5_9HYPH|nr:type VI secretion system-associated protein TagF [Phyllobacterium myrsinacearum]MBA8879729.1 type VI secretion system protein ImpM [Phyllobacterium myrsinacearum]
MQPRDTVLAGYFGKVPSKGDFISRRLDRDVRLKLDQWLQPAMQSSREMLADEWMDLYLNAPIWRFYLEASICGPYPVVGMMIPSVDKAGRYFPFLVAAQIPDFPLSVASIARADDWLHSLEDVLLSVLEDEFDIDYFDHQLAKKAFDLDVIPASLSPLGEPSSQAGAFAPLAAALAGSKSIPQSLWWTSGSDRRKPGMSLYPGWPAATAFASFFKDDTASSTFNDEFARARQSGQSLHNNGMFSEAQSVGEISVAGRSHRGTLAEQNTESFVFKLEKGLVSIADGTFGLSRSATISRFLLASLDSVPLPESVEDALRILTDRLEDAKHALTERLDIAVAGLALQAGSLSFVFRQRRFGLLVQGNVHCLLLRDGQVTELTDTALSKRSSSTLKLQLHAASATVTGDLMPGDRFLLMTANIARSVLDNIVSSFSGASRVESIVDRLVDDSLINGAEDNLTIVAIAL